MHLVFPTACILPVFPNPELEVHQRSLWISSSKAPGMGAFIILTSIHNCYTTKQAQSFMSHNSSHNSYFVS